MYWIRDIEVLAGQKKFTNLGDNGMEIEFNIPFGDTEDPDVAEITIYNLTDSTINDIKKDGYIFVNAGYKMLDNKANIFTGEIEEVKTTWSGIDKVTTITASDGAKNWRKISVNKTYAENTKASAIMRDLCNVLGYEIVAIEPKNDISYPLGKTVTGLASKSLKQLAKDTESKMFINKNRITIREENKGYETGFILNSDTGLIGSPTLNKDETGDQTDGVAKEKDKKKNEKTEQSWTVTSLLNAKLETDAIIKVESKSLNGTFRVKSGRHTKEFNTEMEVVPIE